MELRPSEIRYSQDSINNVFDNRSRHAYTRIGETLDDLCIGRCTVESIPNISVMKRNGHWTTGDNRRLWVFRQLERLGKCETIPVQITLSIPPAKLTSINGGVSIVVRKGGPGGTWYIRPDAPRRRRIDEMNRTSNGTYSTPSRFTTSNISNDIGQQSFRTGSSFSALSTTSSSTPSSQRRGRIDEMSRTSYGTYSTPSRFTTSNISNDIGQRNCRTRRSFSALSTTSSSTPSSQRRGRIDEMSRTSYGTYSTPSRFTTSNNSNDIGQRHVRTGRSFSSSSTTSSSTPSPKRRGRIDEMSRTSYGTYSTLSRSTTSNMSNDI